MSNNMKRVLLTAVAALLLVVMSVGATLAYLTSTTDVVNNTFTVGNIKITLDEAKVDLYGVPQVQKAYDEETGEWSYGPGAREDAERVLENDYKLLPGHTYTKDPTVHVVANSEESYIAMVVSISHIDELKAIFGNSFLPQDFVEGWNPAIWVSTEQIVQVENTCYYEFRYYKTVNTLNGKWLDLEPLFTEIVVPGSVTNEQLATLEDMEINVIAYAIQADGFEDADEAWDAFDAP